MVNFGPPETVPERFRDRRFYQHNPTVTLMRTTTEENAELGRIIGGKLGEARGPLAVLLPKRGVSALDREGQGFFDPAAREALYRELRAALGDDGRCVEIDCHINDPKFAEAAAQAMLEALSATRAT